MNVKPKFLYFFMTKVASLITVLSLQFVQAQTFEFEPNIADDTRNGTSSDAIEVQISHNGFLGIYLREVSSFETAKLHHAPHITGLLNVMGDDGKTRPYLAITHPNKFAHDLGSDWQSPPGKPVLITIRNVIAKDIPHG